MTFEEFMTEFEKVAPTGEWVKCSEGTIRERRTRECPGCFLASMLGKNPAGYTWDVKSTGLPMEDADLDRLIEAADNTFPDPDLTDRWKADRERMLKVCGV